MRRIAVMLGMLLAAVAGIASASLVTAGAAPETSLDDGEVVAAEVETGEPVPDPHGGLPWAVRMFDGSSASRCIVAGRLEGTAFGPADDAGHVEGTAAIVRGSCADPAGDPVQVALWRQADVAGTGPRTVLFGVADASVASIEIAAPGLAGRLVPDATGTFLVVGDELLARESAVIVATLRDGTSRTYRR